MKNLFLGPVIAIGFLLVLIPGSAFALTISPVKLELEVDPGQTIGGTFDLHNEESIERMLYVSYENFEPSGDLGTPRFVGAETGLATWLAATPELMITPDQRVTIPYTITVPKDTKPGGYFAAIFYGSQNPNVNAGGEVAIGGKLGILLLLRVRGDITEEGGINSFITQDAKRVYAQLPLTFVTQMTNRGADRILPQGAITLVNMFGMNVSRLEVNTNQGSILPNSSRAFTSVWGSTSATSTSSFFAAVAAQWSDVHIGYYRAQVELVWGGEKNVSTASYWLLVFPWQLLLCLASGLGTLFMLLRFYNRTIIARSRK